MTKSIYTKLLRYATVGLLAVAIVLVAFVAVACNQPTPHTHVWTSEQVTITPTCTTDGQKTFYCACGQTKQVTFSALQHDYVARFDDDNHWQECSRCLDKKDVQPHVLMERAQPSTCVTQGNLTSACDCGYSKTTLLDLLPHKWQVMADNDCHYEQCKDCTVIKQGSTAQHTLQSVEKTVAPKCEERGYDVCLCSCGHTYFANFVNATGHSLTSAYDNADHWQQCSNCTYATAKQAHTAPTVTPATQCGGDETTQYACACGYDATFSKVVQHVGQQQTGKDENYHWTQCSSCGQQTDKQEHICAYQSTQSGHVGTCNGCGYVCQPQNHDYAITAQVEQSTCSKQGYQVLQCVCGATKQQSLPLKQHSYSATYDGDYEGDCQHYGYYVEKCVDCGATNKVYDKEYGNHVITYHEMVEQVGDKVGNVNYWECTVCGKYFSSKNCQTELTAEQVFVYPPQAIVAQSVNQLYEIAYADDFVVNQPSKDYYQITLAYFDSDDVCATFIDEQYDEIDVTLQLGQYVSQFSLGDQITLKARLFVDEQGDVFLVDAVVLSAPTHADVKNLTVTVLGTDADYNVCVQNEGGDDYCGNTNAKNGICVGATLTINAYVTDKQVGYVKVNGVMQQLTQTNNGVSVQVNVTQDVAVEVFYGEIPTQFASIAKINCTSSGTVYDVNEYLWYCYTGSTHEYDGRLYAGSNTVFAVNGAIINKVVIEFDSYNQDKLPQNVLWAGKDANHLVQVTVGVSNFELQYEFTQNQAVTVLKYVANAQARVNQITVYYTPLGGATN